ncbi:hypothetical protein D0T24_16005 [Duganella sp. BJB480]|uniref:hypothetical protein n=1 Tax=unclassified Duganella TaxID=2636909 RepID=UPI000E3560DA|nr:MULTISPECIES: hypothetical protein [unclassified Duganella]NVD70202.1 hypothetical protein [Duganella sp. BJB1802]RFP22897.1 hypothetical protein D0T26_07625 [Duganella sp. BJB489]RFP33896.1 hypothetical protein D0T24_16005 [Duganella sp. BJB480]
MNGHPSERQYDVAGATYQTPTAVNISESERLKFAKQILLGLALLCTSAMAGYAYYPENRALVQVFELVKIGAFPLVTLVISFYFTNGSKK